MKPLLLPQRNRSKECLVAFRTNTGEWCEVTAKILENGVIRTNLAIPSGWTMIGVVGHDRQILKTVTVAKRSMINKQKPQMLRSKFKKIKRDEKIKL